MRWPNTQWSPGISRAAASSPSRSSMRAATTSSRSSFGVQLLSPSSQMQKRPMISSHSGVPPPRVRGRYRSSWRSKRPLQGPGPRTGGRGVGDLLGCRGHQMGPGLVGCPVGRAGRAADAAVDRAAGRGGARGERQSGDGECGWSRHPGSNLGRERAGGNARPRSRRQTHPIHPTARRQEMESARNHLPVPVTPWVTLRDYAVFQANSSSGHSRPWSWSTSQRWRSPSI